MQPLAPVRRLAAIQFCQQPRQLAAGFISASAGRAASQPNYDIEAAQPPTMTAEYFPYHTLHAVTVDSSRCDSLTGDNSDTGLVQAIGLGKNSEVPASAP